MPRTMFEKVWEAHEVADGLLYIDLHLVHEVTSAQAFDGLRMAGRRVRRPDRTLATADHNVPTGPGEPDELSRRQLEALDRNCREFGVRLYALGHRRQGIVHVIGPELGISQPGMTIVCGDSHTSTHGAFGALAFGIGTSEVEHVLATQTLPQKRPRTMRIEYRGKLGVGCTAKDMILGTIGQIGTDGASGHVVEYSGEEIRRLSMEGRMTICNMSIEAGARAGMVAPDDTTFAYVEGRPGAPADWGLRSKAGGLWPATRAPASTRRSRSTWPRWRRRFPGVPTRVRWRRSPARCRSPATTSTSGRSSTWTCDRGPPYATFESTGSSWAPARTAASRICGPRPASSTGDGSPPACAPWSSPGRFKLRFKLRLRV